MTANTMTSIMTIDGYDGVPIPQTNFQNELLQKSTLKIVDIYSKAYLYAKDKNAQIAKILAEVADKKAYTDDGFTSVAEYAEKTFGMKKAKAHEYVRAGRIYNDKEAPTQLKEMTPSNIAALSGVSMETIKSDIASGKLNTKASQNELRDYAKSVKTTGALTPTENPGISQVIESEIVDTYSITTVPLVTGINGEPAFAGINMDIDSICKLIVEYGQNTLNSVSCETIDLPKAKIHVDDKRGSVPRKLFIFDSTSLVVYFHKYVAPDASKKDDISAIVKGMTAKELAEAVAMFNQHNAASTQDTEEVPDLQ